MFSIIITLIIICAVLLILVVLAQNPKGGGLSDQFGGSSSSQLIGVKRTGDLLEKITWGLIVAIFVLSVSSKVLFSGTTSDESDDDANTVEIVNPPAPQPAASPAAPQPTSEETKNALEGLGGEPAEEKEGTE